jgi:hypothetical protein
VPLANPGRGVDSFDGGRGFDVVSYQARTSGVRVDLAEAAAAGRQRKEPDSVRSIEIVVGGAGDDRLAGDRRSNTLFGEGGDDRIVGRGRADTLHGGDGRNVLVAGPGDDGLGGDGRMSCGPGSDTVISISTRTFLEGDCEQLIFDFLGQTLFGDVDSLLPLRKGRPPNVMSAALSCMAFATDSGCRLDLELLVHGPVGRRGTAPPRGTLLGSASYGFATGEQKTVTLGLSPAGVAILRRHGALRVRVAITADTPGPRGYLTVLRAP